MCLCTPLTQIRYSVRINALGKRRRISKSFGLRYRIVIANILFNNVCYETHETLHELNVYIFDTYLFLHARTHTRTDIIYAFYCARVFKFTPTKNKIKYEIRFLCK